MKDLKQAKKGWDVKIFKCVTFLFSTTFFLFAGAQHVSLNFDQLFPEHTLSVVLDGLMEVQHELQVRCAQEFVDEHQDSLFVDAIVGRLFHLVSCLENRPKDSLFHAQDVSYLATIIEKLLVLSNELQKRGLPQRFVHAQKLLKQIRQNIH